MTPPLLPVASRPAHPAPEPAPPVRIARASELSGLPARTIQGQAAAGRIPGAFQDDIGHWWIPAAAAVTLERGRRGNPKWKKGVPQPRAKRA